MLRAEPRAGSSGDVDERLDRALEIIERNVHRQTRLIEDLLDVSRIATGQLRIEPRRLDLGAVVRDVVYGLCATAATSKVTLVCERVL